MRTRIYQINSKRDVNRVKFEGLDLLERYQGSSAVDPSIYDEVFNAEIDETDLEAIYQRFNTVGHPLHRGHSLSVSDVVVNDNGAFFCDSIGFQPIAFDESQTQKPDNLMRVVYVEPHKAPYRMDELFPLVFLFAHFGQLPAQLQNLLLQLLTLTGIFLRKNTVVILRGLAAELVLIKRFQ